MMTTTLDETLRLLRRERVASLHEMHEAALKKDIDSMISMDELREKLIGLASYTDGPDWRYGPTRVIEFRVEIPLKNVVLFARENTRGYIDAGNKINIALSDIADMGHKGPMALINQYYRKHPYVQDVIKRVIDFCGPTTEIYDPRGCDNPCILASADVSPQISIKFTIPMSV